MRERFLTVIYFLKIEPQINFEYFKDDQLKSIVSNRNYPESRIKYKPTTENSMDGEVDYS